MLMAKMGRPKCENNMDHVCIIRMDEFTVKRLEAYCKKMRLKKSVVIREAIIELVDERSKFDE